MRTAAADAPNTSPQAGGASAPAWHALEVEQALAHWQVSAALGLGRDEALRRLAQHGPNALPETPPRPLWALLLRQFRSPLIYLLGAAAGVALALGHFSDAGVIVAVLLVNAVIGTLQEGRAERSMAELKRLSTLQVRVRRGGQETVVGAADLVPGDVLLLAAGDAVPADARLLEAAQLQAAEAALTGESLPVPKSVPAVPAQAGLADRPSMLHAGTHLSAGRATALVVATGQHTEVGHIAGLTSQAEEPPTPLERRLARFGRLLVLGAMVLFAVVMALGLWRGLPLDEVLMVAISQMVSMVPEGLPVAMTIALAVGMQRMAARGAVIRRLSAVETLGSTTVICSDKTGTLTRNEMTAVAIWLPPGGQGAADGGALRIAVTGSGYDPSGQLQACNGGDRREAIDGQHPGLLALLHAATLCNDAEWLPPDAEHGEHRVLGDPTEGALVVLAVKAGIAPATLRQDWPRRAELPFDADSKLMATACAAAPDGAGSGRLRVFVKGAPEAVLRLCGESPLAESARAEANAMAERALRVLGFAVIETDGLDPGAGFEALMGRGRLLGLIGQIDPPRREVREAVAQCRAAGIRPIMVTGDHKLTGLAIARDLGIAPPTAAGPDHASLAIDGPELTAMDDAALQRALADVAVFARVQPAQKLRIVQALQRQGAVVAMTGDGVNDAPALARADVGVAMGITGTEVAKSAAKVVLSDDNFATLVAAVEQGRVVYGNLKKVLLYLLATSLAEVLVLLIALASGLPLPLAAVQILWINIVTEGTVTVNLVLDPPDGAEMKRTPVGRDDPLLDRSLLLRMALMTPLIAGVTLAWFAWRLAQGTPEALARTETFTLLAMCQWYNVLNCQSAWRSAIGPGLWRNRWLAAGLMLSVLLQLAVLYWPPLAELFHTVALPASTLALLLALASVVLWAEEARKWVVRARPLRPA